MILEREFGLKKSSKQRFIDLGSGNGSIILFSALKYGIKSTGIEINSSLIEEAREKIKILKSKGNYPRSHFRRIKFRQENLFEQDLSKFDFVYLFALPTFMKYLRNMFLTCKSGAVIIAYKYPLTILEDSLKLERKVIHDSSGREINSYIYSRS